MKDPRLVQLAKILTDYSIKTQKGNHVWIRVTSPSGLPLAREVYKHVLDVGADPYIDIQDERLSKYYFDHASKEQIQSEPKIGRFVAEWADQSVIILADENSRELAEANSIHIVERSKVLQPIREISMKKPWVLTAFPTHAMAQDANMSLDDLEDFYFEACLCDWNEENKRFKKLASMLKHADAIEVKGKNTDFRCSSKNRVFVPDDGTCNMPGGEIFTAPVDDSAEGELYFDFPLLWHGKMIRDIHLWFKKGRVVKATASENQEFFLHTLDSDEGARRLGEFAIGMNPGVRRYMFNMLFDEKIQGTIHLALGEAYEECGGVNKSATHMDIVKDMRLPQSTVTIDGKVILHDGELIV